MEHFSQLVGLEQTKRQLSFYLQNNHSALPVSPILFAAARGRGKTTVATVFAETLRNKDGSPRPYKLLSAANFRDFRQMYDEVLLPHVIAQEHTIIFDEAHEFKKTGSIIANFLTLLAPNQFARNRMNYGGQMIEIDFRDHIFLFTTTDIQKLWPPFVDRMDIIRFEDYSSTDLWKIFSGAIRNNPFNSGKTITFTDSVQEEIEKHFSASPRQVIALAQKVSALAIRRGLAAFSLDNFKEVIQDFALFRSGLQHDHIRLLKAIRYTSARVTALAATLEKTVGAIRADEEVLLRNGLMTIGVNSLRQITEKGIRFLTDIEKKGKKA